MKKLSIKDLIKDFFDPNIGGNWDVHFEDIVKQFKIPRKDLPKLQKTLNELEEEGWICTSPCEHDTYEYDPGDNFGVWS